MDSYCESPTTCGPGNMGYSDVHFLKMFLDGSYSYIVRPKY